MRYFSFFWYNASNFKEEQMTKADLIDKMAKDADIAKTAAGKALDSMIEAVTKA